MGVYPQTSIIRMNKLIVSSFAGLFLASCATMPSTTSVSQLKTAADSVSYSLGVEMAKNLNGQGVDKVNKAMMNGAFNATMDGKTPLISNEERSEVLNNYFNNLKEIKEKEAKAEEIAFLNENRKKEGVIETASGLQYKYLTKGEGKDTPSMSNKVKVHYTGRLINGDVFDSSVERGQPATFGVGQVIRGWTEALQLMHVGDKMELYIPSDLGYGARGAGGKIKPHSLLIFEVELLEIL